MIKKRFPTSVFWDRKRGLLRRFGVNFELAFFRQTWIVPGLPVIRDQCGNATVEPLITSAMPTSRYLCPLPQTERVWKKYRWLHRLIQAIIQRVSHYSNYLQPGILQDSFASLCCF
jgi:hypothetical protein